MKIDNSQTKVSFEFSPSTHFLVYSKDDRFGDNGGHPVYTWSLNGRIDMSYKGKDDQCGIADIYLSEEEAEQCKKAGFTWIEM